MPVIHGGKLERRGGDTHDREREKSAPHEPNGRAARRLAHIGHGVSAETILSTVSSPGLYLAKFSRSFVRSGSSAG